MSPQVSARVKSAEPADLPAFRPFVLLGSDSYRTRATSRDPSFRPHFFSRVVPACRKYLPAGLHFLTFPRRASSHFAPRVRERPPRAPNPTSRALAQTFSRVRRARAHRERARLRDSTLQVRARLPSGSTIRAGLPSGSRANPARCWGARPRRSRALSLARVVARRPRAETFGARRVGDERRVVRRPRPSQDLPPRRAAARSFFTPPPTLRALYSSRPRAPPSTRRGPR